MARLTRKKARAAQGAARAGQSLTDQAAERSFSHLPMAGVTSFCALPLT